jgi:hypothetical protein
MSLSMTHSRSRRWIWFFLVLALLAAGAIVVPIVYNLSIQLRPEQLADARKRWRENGPADYDLSYLVKRTEHDHTPQPEDQEYFVQVRAGRVVLVVQDGEVVYLDRWLSIAAGLAVLALPDEDAPDYGVPALFDQIEVLLPRDASLRRLLFVTAQFDPKDGHPYHFVIRVRGTVERSEWNIKLTRIDPLMPSK